VTQPRANARDITVVQQDWLYTREHMPRSLPLRCSATCIRNMHSPLARTHLSAVTPGRGRGLWGTGRENCPKSRIFASCSSIAKAKMWKTRRDDIHGYIGLDGSEIGI
jgi:hypothetical protein